MSDRPLFVVGGLGDGSGTGAATAKIFSKAGYSIALIQRDKRDTAQKLAEELNKSGGDAAAFPVPAYTPADIQSAFAGIQKHWPNAHLRVALFNIGATMFKSFLDVTQEEVDREVDIHIRAAYAFSREVILRQKQQPLDDKGKRGTFIFTGATAGTRGTANSSGFAPGKSAMRALSQSLAKEFNKDNIHVTHAIIDGLIAIKVWRDRKNDEEWWANPDNKLKPESIAEAYLYLANQDRSAWTWELDLRPAHEKW